MPEEAYEAARSPRKVRHEALWIKPVDAVDWLSQKLGGDAAAKSAIAERLKDGAIRCTFIWTSREPDVGSVAGTRPRYKMPNGTTNKDCFVSPFVRSFGQSYIGLAFWNISDDWEGDQKRWNWGAGIFITSCFEKLIVSKDGVPVNYLKSRRRYRNVAYGVLFLKDDIARIVGKRARDIKIKSDFEVRGSKESRNNYARNKKHKMTSLMIDLESKISSGEISELGSPIDYGILSRIERYIMDNLDCTKEDGPSESTVRRRARKILKIWQTHSEIQHGAN